LPSIIVYSNTQSITCCFSGDNRHTASHVGFHQQKFHRPEDGQPPKLHDAEPDAAGLEPCQLTQQYHIEVPPSLPYNTLQQAFQDENQMLQTMIVEVGQVLGWDYAQMKLMDIENESLQKKAFMKGRSENLPLARHTT
jgi:hypothetical protein